jgi:hypothetical protein
LFRFHKKTSPGTATARNVNLATAPKQTQSLLKKALCDFLKSFVEHWRSKDASGRIPIIHLVCRLHREGRLRRPSAQIKSQLAKHILLCKNNQTAQFGAVQWLRWHPRIVDFASILRSKQKKEPIVGSWTTIGLLYGTSSIPHQQERAYVAEKD